MAFLYLPISWAQPLWWLGVTYCIMPSVEGYGVSVCNSYSYSGLGLGCPCLSSSFAAPVLYWSSNLIKHVSLKMQYPAHQHMGLEHFVLAAPAVSLIRFAACTSVLHLHHRLTLPATGLCKNTSSFPAANQPHLPPTILAALQRTHIPAIHLHNAFRHTLRAKLNALGCTTAKREKIPEDSTQTANQFYTLPIKQKRQNMNAGYIFALYLTLIPLYDFKYTHTNLCTKIDTYRHKHTEKAPLLGFSSEVMVY